MSEPFRSLASIFAQRGPSPERERVADGELRRIHDDEATCSPELGSSGACAARAPEAPPDERIVDLLDTFVAELARLHVRAAERLEERAEAVLNDLARHVLARELATAPVALEALVAEALGELETGAGIVVRVCASDAERLHERFAVAATEALGPGDFVIEVDDGRYDLALQTRFEAMLASHRIAL